MTKAEMLKIDDPKELLTNMKKYPDLVDEEICKYFNEIIIKCSGREDDGYISDPPGFSHPDIKQTK